MIVSILDRSLWAFFQAFGPWVALDNGAPESSRERKLRFPSVKTLELPGYCIAERKSFKQAPATKARKVADGGCILAGISVILGINALYRLIAFKGKQNAEKKDFYVGLYL